MDRFFVKGVIILLLISSVVAQTNEGNDVNYYRTAGISAYQSGDFVLFRDNFRQALELRPENPIFAYNLACGYALTGEKDKALDLLEGLAWRGLDFGIDRDTDFNSIRDSERFRLICEKLAPLRKTINNSEVAFLVKEKDLIPEGIAYDPVTETFFLSSVYKRKIVSICKKGTVKDFTSEAQDGLWGVLGMKVDPQRRQLWVCSSSSNSMKGFTPKDSGKAFVHKFDLFGRLIKKYTAPNKVYHEFNDLVISHDGDVYLTDSHTGEIFFIHHQRDTLELLFEEGLFTGSNGIALSNDDKLLFIAAYNDGLYVVKVADGSHGRLKVPENFTPYGIDGLYFYDNSLIAVQNAINPDRITRYFLDDNMDVVVDVKIIEMNNEYFNEPTTGTIAGNQFYYIANSQLGSFDAEGQIFPMERLSDVVILKAEL